MRGCGLGEASTSSTSVVAVKRMERRKKRGMESVRDIEDDAGSFFKHSKLAGAATYGT